MTGIEEDMETNKRGGKQGKVEGRWDLLPAEALRRAAVVMEENLKSHGKDNWRMIDRADHANHIIAHVYDWVEGKRNEDHLAHALCRALFACSTLAEDTEVAEMRHGNTEVDEEWFSYMTRAGVMGEYEKEEDSGSIRIVYVCHPMRGGNGIAHNVEMVKHYALAIASDEAFRNRHVVFVPHLAFIFLPEYANRLRLMSWGRKMLSICSDIVVCGLERTAGMMEEIKAAEAMKINAWTMDYPDSSILPRSKV